MYCRVLNIRVNIPLVKVINLGFICTCRTWKTLELELKTSYNLQKYDYKDIELPVKFETHTCALDISVSLSVTAG